METPNLHLRPIGNSLWRAGAGAGKTYNLVERVMRLAEEWSSLHDGQFPRIAVTTFTRMATQELRVRLMEAALGRPELIPFVTSRSQLFVTTLHGIMDSFLRSFGSEIGLEPGFRVGGSEEIDSLVRRVGNKVLFSPQASSELSAKVDELMGEFDFATTLRLLIRVSRLRAEFDGTDQPAKPVERADLLEMIAGSLKNRIEPLRDLRNEIAGYGSFDKWTPYREWLDGLLKALVEISDPASISVASDLDDLGMWLDSAPKVVNSGKQKIFESGVDWKKPIKDLSDLVSDLEIEIPAIERFTAVNEALSYVEVAFSELLRQEKFRSGLIELEDLELLALEIVRKSPKAAETFAEGWDHWLIDEYQDTSPRQVLLIEALAKARPVFVVGDPQQSIYLFRGARPHVFFNRESQAAKEGHEVVQLQGNRRSHPEVMGFINSCVDRMGADFQPMTAERRHMAREGLRETSVRSPFGPATFLALEPRLGDETGKPLKIDELRRIESEHMARAGLKLSRSNKDLAIVAREFVRQGLPIQIHTAGAYSDRLEISDLCAALSFLSNPHDDENLIHLGRTAWFPIDENVMAKGYHRTTSLWSVIEALAVTSPGQHPEIEKLRAGLLAAKERGIVQAFRELLVACDFFSWCGVLDPSGRREANALKFISKLATAERQAGFLARRFVDEVLGGSDRGSGQGGENESNDRDAIAAAKPDRIHLMTIHVSKGLEFDHVFLPFLGDGGARGRSNSEFVVHEMRRLWTVGLSVDDESPASAGPLAREWSETLSVWGLEERKRLLYVALTRARESLFLSATGEASTNSFLEFLDLKRDDGLHTDYRTLKEIPLDAEDGAPSGFATVDSSRVRDPWRGAETRNEKRLVSISVTRLLELEDSEGSRADARPSAAPHSPAPTRSVESSPTNSSAQSSARSLALATAAARGTRLHRVFEMAKPQAGGDTHRHSEALAQEIARWFVGPEQDEAREALQWLLNLKEPKLEAVLSNGEAEWSFTYVKDSFAVDGQIDLWGRDSEGRLWIADYKTGDSSYKDKAFRQLKLYAEALIASGHAKKNEPIFLAALYPFSKEAFTEKIF